MKGEWHGRRDQDGRGSDKDGGTRMNEEWHGREVLMLLFSM